MPLALILTLTLLPRPSKAAMKHLTNIKQLVVLGLRADLYNAFADPLMKQTRELDGFLLYKAACFMNHTSPS